MSEAIRQVIEDELPVKKKRAKRVSPTQRSRAWLKSRGIISQVVERWNSFAKITQDLFGFCDIVALGTRIVAIQVTSGPNVAARINKIYDSELASAWLDAGGLIEVHGWREIGPSGKRKKWALRRVAIVRDSFGTMVAEEMADMA